MITIKYKGEEYEMKSDVKDFTVEEFEIICHYLQKDTYELKEEDKYSPALNKEDLKRVLEQLTMLDNWFNILEYCGLPDFVLDEIDHIDYFKCIQSLNLIPDNTDNMVKTLEINGHIFTAYDDDEYKIKMKELKEIQKQCHFHPTFTYRYTLAVIFKNDYITNIDEKAAMMSQVNAELVFPYLKYTSDKLINDFTAKYGQQ